MNLKELTIKNALYVIQAKIRGWIKPLPDKVILDRIAKCPDCYRNGECIRCGCDFNEMIKSDKQCQPFRRFDVVAYKKDGEWIVDDYVSWMDEYPLIMIHKLSDDEYELG